MVTPVSPTNITPSTTGSWEDVDVSSYVDSGNTAGVILHVTQDLNTKIGVRCNGSSDTIYNNLSWEQSFFYIGVDDNDILEIKYEDTATDVFLVGYITDSEGSFFTNTVQKDMTGTWIDVDISSDTGSDTSLCAFFTVICTDITSRRVGIRENGSSTSETGGISKLAGLTMGVDDNEILESYTENSEFNHYLTGYLTDNIVTFTNKKDYSTDTTGSYVDTDLSSDVPSGYNGVFLEWEMPSFYSRYVDVRKNGSTRTKYLDSLKHFPFIEIDENRIIEQKIEDTDVILYLWGYTSEPSAAETKTKEYNLDSLFGSLTVVVHETTNIESGV